MRAPISSSAQRSFRYSVSHGRLRAVDPTPEDPDPEPDQAAAAEWCAGGSAAGASTGTCPSPSPSPSANVTSQPGPVLQRLEPRVIGRVAVFAFEAVEGTRQVGQLGRWITARVAGELSAIRAMNIERRSLFHDHRLIVPTVLRVRATEPAPRVTEASVVLSTPSRTRAVALRFEVFRGRWQATSITVL